MESNDRIDVLLVEDSPHESELALRALKKSHPTANVIVAEDGVQALDFLFRRNEYAGRGTGAPRLVLMDYKLPKMNGLEVLRKLRENEETRIIPVVMLTSSQERKDIADSYELGANSYLVKPVDYDQFVECVSMVGEYWLTCNRLPR